jgi:hypothetical protein
MEPSFIRKVTNGELYTAELFQGWQEDEECPEGTIPIKHAREGEYYAHRTTPPIARQKELNIRLDYNTQGHEVYMSYYQTTIVFTCIIMTIAN